MDFAGVSFTSDHLIDRLVFRQSSTINVADFVPYATFTLPHDVGFSFVPFIRYSTDGGDSWYENGAPESVFSVLNNMYVDKLAMTVTADESELTVYYSNNSPFVLNGSIWEIYGIAKNA